MKANFPYCLGVTLVYEGGYSNNPKDPGGSTYKGITQTTYNSHRRSLGLATQDVRKISDSELQSLYRMKFWNLVKGDDLGSGVDLVTWDYAVNSGPSRAWSDLMKCVGGSDIDTIKKLCATRLAFMKRLKTWGTFGKGWSARVNSVEAKGIALAAGGGAAAHLALTTEAEASHKKADVVFHAGAAGATGTLALGVAPVATTATLGLAGWIIVGVLTLVVLGAAGFILWRMAKTHTDRAAAMEAEARGH